ncbi:MAG: GAF domain-containing protein [Candidatus Hydrogenedentes bacterium]|nr:GAF domain-containing protein [Candidatus Hydrogenedentota bacterium]
MRGAASDQAKLKAVINGARAILERKSFVESSRAIFDYCCALTGAVSGYVALLSENGEENEVLFLEAGGRPCTVDPNLPMPIRGLRAVCYETHEPVYENDFMHSEWARFMPEGHVAMQNVLFAPLNIEGRTVGVMGLANKPGDFTDEDGEIAAVFGELAAVALSNSRYIDLLHEKTASLEKAIAQIKTLRGLLPMCSRCKRIRDDEGFWTRVEAYLAHHTDALVSHGLCPDCLQELYPEEAKRILKDGGHPPSS